MTRGRPPHVPTKETRELVTAMVACNGTVEFIADHLRISRAALFKHYKIEVGTGLQKANMKVAGVLFAMATSGEHPSATFFWLKTRARWRETDRLEHVHSGHVEHHLTGASAAELEEARIALVDKQSAADRARDMAQTLPVGPNRLVN